MAMEYELSAGGLIAATLRFRSSFGSFATAASGDGVWTFKRVGFWQNRATIRAAGAETDLAAFKNNTWSGGGTLELPDGRKYLADSNFWSTRYEFKRETGAPLLSYTKVGGLLRMASLVDIHGLSKEIMEMPWIVSFGWYLAVMLNMDSAATVATVVAS